MNNNVELMELKEMMGLVLQAVTNIDERCSRIEERCNRIEERCSRIEERCVSLERRMDNVEDKLDELGEKVHNVQLILENEVHFSICAIGEGHEDITRKLDDVIKFQGKNEMMQLRTLKLEADMREQKTDVEFLKKRVKKLGDLSDRVCDADPELVL